MYLGLAITLDKWNQEIEIDRRISLEWAVYGKLEHIFSMNIAMSLKPNIYNEYMLPVVTNGCEIWTLSKKIRYKLEIHHRK